MAVYVLHLYVMDSSNIIPCHDVHDDFLGTREMFLYPACLNLELRLFQQNTKQLPCILGIVIENLPYQDSDIKVSSFSLSGLSMIFLLHMYIHVEKGKLRKNQKNSIFHQVCFLTEYGFSQRSSLK